MKYCANCGQRLEDSDNYCTECGKYLASNSRQSYEDYVKDYSNIYLNIISFLVPIIGLIFACIFKKRFPIRAESCGKSACWGIGTSLFIMLIFNIICSEAF